MNRLDGDKKAYKLWITVLMHTAFHDYHWFIHLPK